MMKTILLICFIVQFLQVFANEETTVESISPTDFIQTDSSFNEVSCSDVICPPFSCQGGKKIRQGCCDVCYKLIGLGENCSQPLVNCTADLMCDSGLCKQKPTEQLTHCQKNRHNRLNLQKKGELRTGAWIPECDNATGDYIPKQCKEHKCICVDPKSGERLFGQAERFLSENMTCDCAVKIKDRWKNKEKLTEPQIHCTETGDYDVLQCEGNVCYCADPKTGKPKGNMSTLNAIHLLQCYDEEKHKGYLKPCENQIIARNKFIQELKERGTLVYGAQPITCDIDGSFAPVQYSDPTDSYKCTGKDGDPLGEARVNIQDISTAKCPCARDQDYNDRNFASYPQLQCDVHGNYKSFYCLDKHCTCVDEDGEILKYYYVSEGSNVPVQNQIEDHKKKCKELREKLEKVQRNN